MEEQSHANNASPEHPIAKALREELQLALQQSLTLKGMIRLRRLVEAGFKTLAALENAPRLRGGNFVGAVGYDLPLPEEDEQPTYFGSNPAMNGETYGASVVRELVAAASQYLTKKDEDPVKLVQAIAAAKQAGLTDLEQILRARLGIGPDPKPLTSEDYLAAAALEREAALTKAAAVAAGSPLLVPAATEASS
jgi:hypothetical protein